MKIGDIVVSVGIIFMILMIIIPMPEFLVDIMLSMNISLSLLILLIAMFNREALDFSVFPSLLLITTIFRIALNITTTRYILLKGDAGDVIEAFGNFVMGGNAIVGFIVFIIIMIVNFMVITKGSERVSEVAARFTLDAMPGKQMAIDADLNSGMIDETQARTRRSKIQREADFYGSMDGATKFVSGNVKVGIFITVINLVAGVIFGMVLRSEPFNQAIQTYAKFTIGDGLLSQIPSLFISVATGLIVTRSASDGKSSMGQEAQRQFSQNAWIFYVAGVTMALIGFLPGFPWYVLIPLGAALFYIGRRLQIKQAVAFETKLEKEKEKQQTQGGSSADISPIVPLDPLSLELGFALIPLVDKEKGAELLERITRIRRESALDMGLVVPRIRIIDNMRLDPNEYCFKIKGVEVGSSHIRMGWYMCMNTGNVSEEIHGEATTDPAFGLPAVWIPEEQREQAERSGYAVVDAPTIIATHLTELIKSHAAEILGRQEIQAIVDALKKEYPAVVEEVTKLFNMGEIQKVMQGLLKEQVSVRNMVAIFETMADFGPITKKPDVLVEKVRQALGRQICLQYADENRNLRVFTVAPDFLQKLVASRVDTVNGPIAALDPVDQRDWISAVSTSIASSQKTGNIPVILCPEEARILVKASTEREIPNLVVLSVPEIVNDIKLENLGEIRVGAYYTGTKIFS